MPDNSRLINVINAAEESAYGSDTDSQLPAERSYDIGLYLGKNYDPVPEGGSSVSDRSVFETIELAKPALCRIFANGEDIVEIAPNGPDDEEAAKQEGQYLNWMVTQKNNWFEIFLTWSTDALLTKNAYAFAYRDNYVSTSVERYERQTEMGLAMLLQDKDVEVTAQKSYPDPEYVGQPQPVMDPATGQPAIDPQTGQPVTQVPPPPMLYDVELRRKEEKGKVCIRVLAPERCKISERTPSWRLEGCDYFEFWDFKTISDLRSEGFDVDDDIASSEDPETMEDVARNLYNEDAEGERQLDPSMRRVKVRSVWIRHDYDEDGIAELQYVVMVGTEILYREEVSRIPVACIVPIPLGHRHIGLSLADSVTDIQRTNTAILRQGLNNLFQSNNIRHAITGKVNLDDMLMNRAGGVVRLEDGAIPANEIMPLPVPFLFPQAMEALGFMQQVREGRSGVSNRFQSLDAGQLSTLQPGTVNQISSMMGQRVELIARVIACGVEDLFSIVHELILKSGHQKETVKLRGKWVEVDPATWKKRYDFKISVGYAASNTDALTTKYMSLANLQKEAAMAGSPIVQPENSYELAIDITKTMGITSPQRFWTNPADAPKPQPPQPDPSVMFAEQENTKRTLQAKQMDVEQKERDSQRDFQARLLDTHMKADADVVKHRETLQHDRMATQFGADKDVHMARVNAELNPKNVEANAKAQESATSGEVLKALAQSQQQQTQAIMAAIQELAKAMNAPREFVRDPKTGKAVGSRVAADPGAAAEATEAA